MSNRLKFGFAMTLMSYPTHYMWKATSKTVTQTMLNDAFSKVPVAVKMFQPFLGTMHSRTCKKETRIQEKFAYIESHDGQFFKVVSDFIAFRVHCRVTEIDSKIDDLSAVVGQNGGTMWLKGCFRGPKREYADIVQYVYVYVPEIDYIIEFQIGSSFASYTFTIDSKLRDEPGCGEVDLWTDGTYNTVKEYLLYQANNTLHKCDNPSAPSKYDAFQKVYRLFPAGEVPAELRKVLDDLD